MDEPQTLDQVMDAAANPAATTDSTLPAAEAEQTTPQKSTEVTEAEDTYTRIDPKTLPPELQGMHKSLLRDYTKKTQAIAKQRKEIEAWKAEYESLKSAKPAPAPQVQAQPVPEVPDPNWTLEQFNAWNLAKVDERIALKEQQALEAQQQKFLEKAVSDVEAMDERLNPESPAYDDTMRSVIGTKLDVLLQEYAKQNGNAMGFDYLGNAKNLVEQYEQYMESRGQQIAAQKTKEAFNGVKRTAPHGVNSSSAPSKPAGGMSLDEALDDAFSKT